MACDSASVQAWASGLGIPACIGTAFCAQYNRLPNSVDELDSWGDSSGYRQGGNWSCTPSGGTGGGGGSTGSGSGSGSGGTVGTGGGSTVSPLDWIKANQIEAGLAGLVVLLLVMRR